MPFLGNACNHPDSKTGVAGAPRGRGHQLLKDCEELQKELLDASRRMEAEKAAFQVEKSAWAANAQNASPTRRSDMELIPDFTKLSISPSDTVEVNIHAPACNSDAMAHHAAFMGLVRAIMLNRYRMCN